MLREKPWKRQKDKKKKKKEKRKKERHPKGCGNPTPRGSRNHEAGKSCSRRKTAEVQRPCTAETWRGTHSSRARSWRSVPASAFPAPLSQVTCSLMWKPFPRVPREPLLLQQPTPRSPRSLVTPLFSPHQASSSPHSSSGPRDTPEGCDNITQRGRDRDGSCIKYSFYRDV